MDDIFVYIVDMPTTASEMIMPCSDGYTIYINAKLSYHDRVKAYLHALGHVEGNDWEKVNVQEIEKDAHRKED